MPRSSQKQAEALLMELLALPGGSGSETEVMEFIAQRLRKAGAPAASIESDSAHRRSVHGGDAGNMVLRLPGTRGSARGSGRRMFSAHADTVPLCQGARPVRRGNRIVAADKQTALGADDRTGCAVVLGTALDILRSGQPHPPLTFLWTVQEEIGLHGARHVRLGMLGKPAMAFNFDGGSAEKLTIGATGGYRMDIRVHGIASHAGGAPEEGVSAITIASLAVSQLHREGWLGLIEKHGRQGTSNVGVIHGGDATNVVTSFVEVKAEARSHDARFRRRIQQTIERAFTTAVREVTNHEGRRGAVEIDGRLDYEAFKLRNNDLSLRAAEAAVRAAGGEPVRAICNGGLDANWLTARGIPTVSLGCGQKKQHTVGEWVDLRQFHRAREIAWLLATGKES